jgi:hypothetical protein
MAGEILTTGSLPLFSLDLFFHYNQKCFYVCLVKRIWVLDWTQRSVVSTLIDCFALVYLFYGISRGKERLVSSSFEMPVHGGRNV